MAYTNPDWVVTIEFAPFDPGTDEMTVGTPELVSMLKDITDVVPLANRYSVDDGEFDPPPPLLPLLPLHPVRFGEKIKSRQSAPSIREE